MNNHRRIRGLSPLVASTILAIIAVIGGIILYQYYNGLLTSLTSSSEMLVIKRARIIEMNENTALAYIDVWNPSPYTAKVTTLIIDTDYKIAVNRDVPPSSTIQLIIKIKTSPKTIELKAGTKHYISLAYTLKGTLHYTELYQVIVE